MSYIHHTNRQIVFKALQILYAIILSSEEKTDHLVIYNDAVSDIEERLGK